MAHCYQLTPTLVLPFTFQRCSRRLLLFLPSAVECRGRGRKWNENNKSETKTNTSGRSSIFDPYPFPSVELKKSGNARKHKFSRQSLIRKRNPCHRSHWSHIGLPVQWAEKWSIAITFRKGYIFYIKYINKKMNFSFCYLASISNVYVPCYFYS